MTTFAAHTTWNGPWTTVQQNVSGWGSMTEPQAGPNGELHFEVTPNDHTIGLGWVAGKLKDAFPGMVPVFVGRCPSDSA